MLYVGIAEALYFMAVCVPGSGLPGGGSGKTDFRIASKPVNNINHYTEMVT